MILHHLVFILTSTGLLAMASAQGDQPCQAEACPDLTSLHGSTNSTSCFTENSIWLDDMMATFVNVTSVDDCQELCTSTPYCSHFTWFGPSSLPYPHMCALYPHISRSIECSDCTAGPASCVCSFEHACMLHADMIIDIIDPVYDEVECQAYCRVDFDCSFYSWFDSNGTLFQVRC